jgi:hypothetical protein
VQSHPAKREVDKRLTKRFLREIPEKEKSENRRVCIGDLNGGALCTILHRAAQIRASMKRFSL